MRALDRLLGRPEFVMQVRPDVTPLTKAVLFSKLAELASEFRRAGNSTPAREKVLTAVFNKDGQVSALFYALDDSNPFQDLRQAAVTAAASPTPSPADVLATFEAVWEDYAKRKLSPPKNPN